MLFDALETFEDSPLEFDVQANLKDEKFYNDLSQLENSITSSTALKDRVINVSGYINLNDTVARNKIALLQTDLNKTINLSLNKTLYIESKYINDSLKSNNALFTKNLERILREANKESFFSKIGSVLTAPVRAIGASLTQVAKGSLFSIGEAAIRPVQDKVASKLAPITQFVANRSANAVDNVGNFIKNRSGITSEQSIQAFNYLGTKIDDIFDANNIYNSIKTGISYLGKLQYETREQSTIKDKFNVGSDVIKNDILDSLANNNALVSFLDPKFSKDFAKDVEKLDFDLFQLNKVIISLIGSVPNLSKAFFEFGAIQEVKKQKAQLDFDLDKTKDSKIAIGGFFNAGGIGSDDVAIKTKAAFPDSNVFSFQNKSYDPNAENPSNLIKLFDKFFNKLDSNLSSVIKNKIAQAENLAKNAFIISPDDIRLSAQALYLAENSTGVDIQAFCGGGFLAKGAIDLINATAPENKITATAYGAGLFGATSPNAPNLRNIVSNNDPASINARLTGSNAQIFDQGNKINPVFHSAGNYLQSGQLGEVQLKTSINKISDSIYGIISFADKLENSVKTLEKQRTPETNDDVDFLLNKKIQNSTKIQLEKSADRYFSILEKISSGKEVNEIDLFFFSYYERLKDSFNKLKKNLIDSKKFIELIGQSSIFGDLQNNTNQLFLAPIKNRFNEINNINLAQENAKGKISQAFFNTASPQPNSLLNNNRINSALSNVTADNMQFNYVQSKLYGGNNQATSVNAEVVTPLSELANDFVKYGKYYSAKMWAEVYNIITKNAVNSGLDTLSIQQAFTNLNIGVRQTTNQINSMYSNMKKLESLMVGDLAARYRQYIKTSAVEVANPLINFGQTQFKLLTQDLQNSLNAGINNAIENSDRYKNILEIAVIKLFVNTANTYTQLAEREKAFFEKYKALQLVKFGIQAGLIAKSPLALPGSSVGAEMGANLASPVTGFLEGAGNLLGGIPFKGEAIQQGTEIFAQWFQQAFTELSASIGSGAASVAELGAINTVKPLIDGNINQFAAERQTVNVLPGSTDKKLKAVIDSKDDFIKSVLDTKEIDGLLNLLRDYTQIPAKQLYKVARTLGSSISARASKTDVLKELQDINPELVAFQAAIVKTFHQVKGVTREERIKLTEQYNQFASTVRSERDILITSNLPKEDIKSGLQEIINRITDFQQFVNINAQQFNSLKGIKDNLRLRIDNLSDQSNTIDVTSTVAERKQEPLNLRSKFEVESNLEYKPKLITNTQDISNQSKKVGLNISEGVRQGINEGKKDALNDIITLAKALILVAQEELEIKSPSGKSRKKIGIPIGQGISQGVINSISGLKNTIKSILGKETYIDINELNRLVRRNSPKYRDPSIEERIKKEQIRNNLQNELGLNRVPRPSSANPILLPNRNKIDNSFYESGAKAGKVAIDGISNAYKVVTSTIEKSTEKIRQFINGNKQVQQSSQFVKGFASNWKQAKEQLGGFLDNFQVFGIQGSTFAKLGVGALGIFAFAKSIEFLSQRFRELIDVSRQAGKVNQFFSDSSSNPVKDIERISNLADRVGLNRLQLLQSSAEVKIGFGVAGYDEKRQNALIDDLNKTIIGRRFSPDEGSRVARAILQTGSKNRFSQEEINQQLADIGIYGAGKIAARATGFGNDQAAFLKATSQGEVLANVVGADGLTNLERFNKLLAQTYGSEKPFDPLIRTTERLNNNLQSLQINTAKALNPFAELVDVPANKTLQLLGNNVDKVIGLFLTMGLIGTATVIPSLIKMASKVGFLNNIMQVFNATGVKGVAIMAQQSVQSSIAASKFLKWGLIAVAAGNSIKGFYDTYINYTSDASKAIDKLIKKEDELRKARTGNKPQEKSGLDRLLQSDGVSNRTTAAQFFAGSLGDIGSGVLSLNPGQVLDGLRKQSVATRDLLLGTNNSSNTFGDNNLNNPFNSKEQRVNIEERNKVKQLIEQRKKDIAEYELMAKKLAKGEFVDPKKLNEARDKTAELNKELKNLNPSVVNSDSSIKSFVNQISKLDNNLYNVSNRTRNLTSELKKLKTQLEENKLVNANLDLDAEKKKFFLPFNDTVVSSGIEYDLEVNKLNKEIELQEKIANTAKEKLNTPDFRNLQNSNLSEDRNKAEEIRSEALQQEISFVNLQVNKQKLINNRRKELFNQEKEKLNFISSSRKLNEDITNAQKSNTSKMRVFNKFGNLESFEAKTELAQNNLDRISNEREQAALEINDNALLYKKGLITTNEYQTNLLNLRLKQVQLEGQFNDGLIELNSLEKEKSKTFSELILKQNEYENKLKENSLTLKSEIIKNYAQIRKEIVSLNSEINNLTTEALTNLSGKISDNFEVIKNIFSDDGEVKLKDAALKSYILSLERISGIRINRDELQNDNSEIVQSKLIYSIEVAKTKLAIDTIKAKKDALLEEIVIQRQIANIERNKAEFNAKNELNKANINLEKAKLSKDPDQIALAELDVLGARNNLQFTRDKNQVEEISQNKLDALKIRSVDLEGAKLSLDLKSNLVNNDKLKPFNDVDPFKNLSNFISRELRPFENSAQYQRREFSNIKQTELKPVLNLVNNFNGTPTQDKEDIGRIVGTEALKAMQQWGQQLTNSF